MSIGILVLYYFTGILLDFSGTLSQLYLIFKCGQNLWTNLTDDSIANETLVNEILCKYWNVLMILKFQWSFKFLGLFHAHIFSAVISWLFEQTLHLRLTGFSMVHGRKYQENLCENFQRNFPSQETDVISVTERISNDKFVVQRSLRWHPCATRKMI